MNGKNNLYLFVTIAFAVGFLAGAGMWAAVGGGGDLGGTKTDDSSMNYEALKTAVLQEYPEYLNGDSGAFSSGIIEEVTDSSIVFTIAFSEAFLIASGIQDRVEIPVDEDVLILKSVQKPESVYREELAAFEIAIAKYQEQIATDPTDENVDIASSIPAPEYPSFGELIEISLRDVRVGNLVTVSSSQGDFIQDTTQQGDFINSEDTSPSTILTIVEDVSENPIPFGGDVEVAGEGDVESASGDETLIGLP